MEKISCGAYGRDFSELSFYRTATSVT